MDQPFGGSPTKPPIAVSLAVTLPPIFGALRWKSDSNGNTLPEIDR